MYIAELIQPLIASLLALSGPDTDVYIAHGRNRQASTHEGAARRLHAAGAGICAGHPL